MSGANSKPGLLGTSSHDVNPVSIAAVSADSAMVFRFGNLLISSLNDFLY